MKIYFGVSHFLSSSFSEVVTARVEGVFRFESICMYKLICLRQQCFHCTTFIHRLRWGDDNSGLTGGDGDLSGGTTQETSTTKETETSCALAELAKLAVLSEAAVLY